MLNAFRSFKVSVEPLSELLRGRGWCHLKARVLLFNPGYHTVSDSGLWPLGWPQALERAIALVNECRQVPVPTQPYPTLPTGMSHKLEV